MAPREALKGRMLEVARDGQYESPIKALLSGLRLAEKMAIIPAIVEVADWMFAESPERLWISRNPRNIRWVEGDIICRIAKRKDTWEWRELECLGLAVTYRSRTCCASGNPGQSHPLEMANFASWERSRGVVNMTRTSDHGRRGGCGSSRKNVINVGWQKTAHMATSHPQIWEKRGWHSWQDRSSNTTGGTVCGEERCNLCLARRRTALRTKRVVPTITMLSR